MKDGWLNYWYSAGGRRGCAHWFGFALAATTSHVVLDTLKNMVVFLWGML